MMQIGSAQLWVHDQDEALEFYTKQVGLEIRSDVTVPELGNFRWLTVAPAGQEDVAITLMAIPGAPVMDEQTAREVRSLMAKGFAGTIKRHKFHRGPKSHGSHNVRKPGSVGASATPSRVFKGVRMAGRLGGKRVTQVGLVVHDVDADNSLLLVKGAVPGPKNALVEVREEKPHAKR